MRSTPSITPGFSTTVLCSSPDGLALSALYCWQGIQDLTCAHTSLRTFGHQATPNTFNRVFSWPRWPPRGLSWKYLRNSDTRDCGTTIWYFCPWSRTGTLLYNTPCWTTKPMRVKGTSVWALSCFSSHTRWSFSCSSAISARVVGNTEWILVETAQHGDGWIERGSWARDNASGAELRQPFR